MLIIVKAIAVEEDFEPTVVGELVTPAETHCVKTVKSLSEICVYTIFVFSKFTNSENYTRQSSRI